MQLRITRVIRSQSKDPSLNQDDKAREFIMAVSKTFKETKQEALQWQLSQSFGETRQAGAIATIKTLNRQVGPYNDLSALTI